MTMTNTAKAGAAIEALLHSEKIHSFADMCRVAASLVALDNAIDAALSDESPVSCDASTIAPNR